MVNTKIVLLIGLAVIGGLVSYGFLRKHNSNKPVDARRAQFKLWIEEHNKSYGGDHDERFKIWNQNVDVIEQHNAKKLSWTLSANQFADLTNEEFSAIYLGLKENGREEIRKAHIARLNEKHLPTSVDWRETVHIPLKDQKQCGSCWAFSSIGALEALNNVTTGKYTELSEQQLVDCIRTKLSNGCNGGEMDEGFEHAIEKGVMTAESYPYKGVDQKCKYDESKTIFSPKNYSYVPANETNQFKAALAKGVVSISVHADQPTFRFYKSGVITEGCIVTELDHGIIAVGYNQDKDGEYWIIRNSWGLRWGEEGFGRIAIGDHNNGGGLCGINMENSYPRMF